MSDESKEEKVEGKAVRRRTTVCRADLPPPPPPPQVPPDDPNQTALSQFKPVTSSPKNVSGTKHTKLKSTQSTGKIGAPSKPPPPRPPLPKIKATGLASKKDTTSVATSVNINDSPCFVTQGPNCSPSRSESPPVCDNKADSERVKAAACLSHLLGKVISAKDPEQKPQNDLNSEVLSSTSSQSSTLEKYVADSSKVPNDASSASSNQEEISRRTSASKFYVCDTASADNESDKKTSVIGLKLPNSNFFVDSEDSKMEQFRQVKLKKVQTVQTGQSKSNFTSHVVQTSTSSNGSTATREVKVTRTQVSTSHLPDKSKPKPLTGPSFKSHVPPTFGSSPKNNHDRTNTPAAGYGAGNHEPSKLGMSIYSGKNNENTDSKPIVNVEHARQLFQKIENDSKGGKDLESHQKATTQILRSQQIQNEVRRDKSDPARLSALRGYLATRDTDSKTVQIHVKHTTTSVNHLNRSSKSSPSDDTVELDRRSVSNFLTMLNKQIKDDTPSKPTPPKRTMRSASRSSRQPVGTKENQDSASISRPQKPPKPADLKSPQSSFDEGTSRKGRPPSVTCFTTEDLDIFQRKSKDLTEMSDEEDSQPKKRPVSLTKTLPLSLPPAKGVPILIQRPKKALPGRQDSLDQSKESNLNKRRSKSMGTLFAGNGMKIQRPVKPAVAAKPKVVVPLTKFSSIDRTAEEPAIQQVTSTEEPAIQQVTLEQKLDNANVIINQPAETKIFSEKENGADNEVVVSETVIFKCDTEKEGKSDETGQFYSEPIYCDADTDSVSSEPSSTSTPKTNPSDGSDRNHISIKGLVYTEVEPLVSERSSPPVHSERSLPPVHSERSLPPIHSERSLPPVHSRDPDKVNKVQSRVLPPLPDSDSHVNDTNTCNVSPDLDTCIPSAEEQLAYEMASEENFYQEIDLTDQNVPAIPKTEAPSSQMLSVPGDDCQAADSDISEIERMKRKFSKKLTRKLSKKYAVQKKLQRNFSHENIYSTVQEDEEDELKFSSDDDSSGTGSDSLTDDEDREIEEQLLSRIHSHGATVTEDSVREAVDEIFAEKVMSKQQRIVGELLATERAYVGRLHLVDQVFHLDIVQENRSQHMFPEEVIPQMFSNIKSIYQFHHDFLLPRLEERMEEWEDVPRIGDIMKMFAPFLKLYTDYVKNFDNAMTVINSWLDKSARFAALMDELHKKPECQKLTLQHHMLEPIQRVPRYELLLKDYIKHLPEDSPDRSDSEKALELVSTAASHSDDAMRKIEKFRKLLDINDSIVGTYDLISPTRELIKEGRIIKLSARDGVHLDRYLFLFNDLFLLCHSLPLALGMKEQYRIKAALDLEGMLILEGDNLETANTFYIRSKRKTIELHTHTDSEKIEWMMTLWTVVADFTKRQLSRKAGLSLKEAESDSSEQSSGGNIPDTDMFHDEDLGKRAPTWIKDGSCSMCMQCGLKFTAFRRRHHCRACGIVVCGKCSTHKTHLAYDDSKANRVCDKCCNILRKQEGQATYPEVVKPQPRKTVLRVKASDQALTKGYLHMTTDIKTWQKRYFAVHDTFVLYSFKAHQDVVAMTSMPLPGYQVLETNIPDKENVFFMRHPSQQKTYWFYTDDKDSYKRWMHVLQCVVQAELPEEVDRNNSFTSSLVISS